MNTPDVVYVVKQNPRNEELRYSLRSLGNLPHDKVWISGYRPPWVSNRVEHISIVQQGRTKYANAEANLQAACAHPEVAERFYLFNDDFFVMQPVDEVPVLHLGTVEEAVDYYRRAGSTTYVNGLQETVALMRECLGMTGDLMFYGIHLPMPLEKARMIETLMMPVRHRRRIVCLHKRTLYGNYWKIGGERAPDCKIMSRSEAFRDRPFLSTTDNSFANHLAGRYIRKTFTRKSPYER